MILYTDKTEIFECQLNIEGASIEDTSVSLVLESKKWNLVFYGEVDDNGKCRIAIPKLDVLKEGDSGRAVLKIIAEDTQFIPFDGDFEVKTNKKVTVESIVMVGSPDNKLRESTKPKVQIANVVLHSESIKNSEPIKKATAPIVTPKVNNVTTVKKVVVSSDPKSVCINEIKIVCEKNNINSQNFNNKRPLFKKIILETLKKHKFDYKQNSTWIMESMLDFFNKN